MSCAAWEKRSGPSLAGAVGIQCICAHVDAAAAAANVIGRAHPLSRARSGDIRAAAMKPVFCPKMYLFVIWSSNLE